jgi:hypothetical protein
MRVGGRKGLTPEQQTAITAVALFIVFHVECERYDKTVCTGVEAADGSGRMPRNTTETGIIVAHADALGEVLRARAHRLGVPMAVLAGAEEFVARMPYAQVEADYPRALRVIGGPLNR